MDGFRGHKSLKILSLEKKAWSHVTCAVTSQVCTCFFKMVFNSESYDSLDSGTELSEFEDVEVLNSAALEIVPWRFELRGRHRGERLYFEREDEERVDRDDRRRKFSSVFASLLHATHSMVVQYQCMTLN